MNNASFYKTPIHSLHRLLRIMIGLAVLIAGVAAPIVDSCAEDSKTVAPVKAADSFQPTPEQWAGLKIETVRQMAFHAQQMTDGKIAINDDTTTPVFSPYSGRVIKLIAKAGDVVKKNDPLFAIEATEFVQAENDLIAASTALKAATAQFNQAGVTEKRQRDLFAIHGTPLKTWEQSQVDLATAHATLRSDEAAYAEARNHLSIFGESDAEIAAIENAPNVKKMNAGVTVKAPRNGTVVQRQIGLGENIQAGASNPVYTIGDLSTVWLIANVREADAPLVHVGAPVEVRVMALPDQIFKANLSYVAPTVDPVTHRLPVRAEIKNPDGVLKPEMFASFSIVTGDETQGLGVPENAVVYEGTAAHVWVVKDDKTIALRNIQTGTTNDGVVQILDGLKADDKIVTSGALFIDRAAAGD